MKDKPVRAVIGEPSRESEAELNAVLGDRIYEFNVEATGVRDGVPRRRGRPAA